jgi:hypothetical protein
LLTAARIFGIRLKGRKIDGTYDIVREEGDKVVIKHPKHGAVRVPRANTIFVEPKRKRANKAEMARRRADPAYQASLLKPKRKRSTQDQMALRRAALLAIMREQHPMTVRQVYYQAEVRGVVDKTENGYTQVQNMLAKMRKDGGLRYEWLVDNTRSRQSPLVFDGPAEAVDYIADRYRRDAWAESDVYCEIWLEKDALSGVLRPVTSKYDVPLMVARGYSSLSFNYEAALNIARQGRPVYIYHLGDFDPSGVDAARQIEEDLHRLAPGAEIHFLRIGVTLEQIQEWNLPTRVTKKTDSRWKTFGYDFSAELDAIRPDDLRSLVQTAIEKHLPPERLAAIRAEEAQERKLLIEWADDMKRRLSDDDGAAD